MDFDEAVVLRTYPNEALASIAASRLGAEGIEAHIQKDDCGGAYPALQMSRGVRLLVQPEDLKDGERILSEREAEDSGKVEEQEEQEDRKTTKSSPMVIFRGIFLFLLGLAAGYYLSPELIYRSTYTGVQKHAWKHGKPGVILHYVDGKVTLEEEDRNYDGKVDGRRKYVGDKIRSGVYDDKFQRRPNRWTEYRDLFNCVSTVDTDFDGKPDATVYYVEGLKQKVEWHPRASANIDRRELYEHGMLKEKLVDTNGDGVFDLKITYDPYEIPIEKASCWIPTYSNRH